MAKKIPDINESFELRGYWWLPQKPETKIPGILKSEPTKIELSLMGTFAALTEMGQPKDYLIILGATEDGHLVTLHKCFQSSYTFSSPGYPTEIIFVAELYLGFHFTNPADIKFKSVTLNLTNFDDWVGISGIKTDYSDFDKSKTIMIKYTSPEKIEYKINDHMKLIISFGYTIGSISQHQMSEGITQKTGITIESDEEIPFTTFAQSINDLKNFLSLAMLEPVYQLKITAHRKKSEDIR